MKLVSEVGVGTVAAGVAKAQADMILISGYDGGTGASPLSSIRHAGAPWELGLAETQQTLVLNGLRSRVRLQVDGQLKTGRDVVIARPARRRGVRLRHHALVVLRLRHDAQLPQEHLPGRASRPRTRSCASLFSGKPEYVVNFLTMVAREAREHMAQLGFRRMDDLVGRSDLLEVNDAITFWKAKGLDFSKILYRPEARPHEVRGTEPQKHDLDDGLDNEILPLRGGRDRDAATGDA